MRFSTSFFLLAAAVVGTTSVLGSEFESLNVRDVDIELAARREAILNFMEARGRGGFGGRRGSRNAREFDEGLYARTPYSHCGIKVGAPRGTKC